jgi:hypothetical protein
MLPRVTGRSLSPRVTEVAGSLPASAWQFQGPSPTTMRDQGGPLPTGDEPMIDNTQHRFYGGVDRHARSMFNRMRKAA